MVCEAELGAGVGPLAPADRAGRLRPAVGGQVEHKLAHPGAVTGLAVRLDGRGPGRLGRRQDRSSDLPAEVIADRKREAHLAHHGEKVVAGAARVAAHQQLVGPLVGQLLDGAGEHLGVIGGRVGAGVSRPKQARQRLAGLVEVAEQGVEAVAVLVGASRAPLVGMAGDQGRASISSVIRSGRAPIRHARVRAAARAERTASSRSSPSAAISRQAVASDATSPTRPAGLAAPPGQTSSHRRRRASPPDRGRSGRDHAASAARAPRTARRTSRRSGQPDQQDPPATRYPPATPTPHRPPRFLRLRYRESASPSK